MHAHCLNTEFGLVGWFTTYLCRAVSRTPCTLEVGVWLCFPHDVMLPKWTLFYLQYRVVTFTKFLLLAPKSLGPIIKTWLHLIPIIVQPHFLGLLANSYLCSLPNKYSIYLECLNEKYGFECSLFFCIILLKWKYIFHKATNKLKLSIGAFNHIL